MLGQPDFICRFGCRRKRNSTASTTSIWSFSSSVGGQRVIQALIAGDLHFTHSGAPTAVRAGAAGAEITIIATVMNRATWKLVTNKKLRSLADLPGKKIAIASRGGSSDLGLQLAFKKWGLDLNQVTLLTLGASTTRLVALRENVVDAALLSYPELQVANQWGFPVLADLRQVAELTDASIVTSKAFVEKQRPLAKRFLQGYVEAIWLAKRNPEIAYRAIARYTGINERPALEASYRFFSEVMPDIPRTDPNGWRNLLSALNIGEKAAARLLDSSLLNELERDRFFDRLNR